MKKSETKALAKRHEWLGDRYLRLCKENGYKDRPVLWLSPWGMSGPAVAFVVLDWESGDGVEVTGISPEALVDGCVDVVRENRPDRN
jgi:hypothetical protein